MEIATKTLLAELIEKTRMNINNANRFKELSDKELNHKKNKDEWSILECIEHLNIYGDFYNPEIKKRIENSQSLPNKIFKSGILGNYFVNLIRPKEKIKKMKTLKANDPSGSHLHKNTIDKFIKQQNECLDLIEKSRNVNLTKTKTAISISKLIKLRLGDTLRFITAHNKRHLIQAENILKTIRT